MAGVTNIVLSIPMSRAWGVVGACVSIFIAYMLRAVAINVVSHRVLKLNIPALIKQCYLRMSLPIILTVAAGFFINSVLPERSWFYFILKAAIVAVIYFLATFFIGLSRNDRMQIKKMIIR
jgi:hypothetical protein